jgi:hypothetical protein
MKKSAPWVRKPETAFTTEGTENTESGNGLWTGFGGTDLSAQHPSNVASAYLESVATPASGGLSVPSVFSVVTAVQNHPSPRTPFTSVDQR